MRPAGNSRAVQAGSLSAFLLIHWSGEISYVRPFFPNGRVGFSFPVYTISKNALTTEGQLSPAEVDGHFPHAQCGWAHQSVEGVAAMAAVGDYKCRFLSKL
jgi:hypothetical protein